MACNRFCRPEWDEHSEECIKSYNRRIVRTRINYDMTMEREPWDHNWVIVAWFGGLSLFEWGYDSAFSIEDGAAIG